MPDQPSNSVFISYRRSANPFLAQAVFQDLHHNGIDTFFDIDSITGGQFDTIILNQISARPYFMPIFTPGTLDRCMDAGDWVRREIEHAMNEDRIIVPLHTPDFNFDDINKFLPGLIARELSRWSATDVPQRQFMLVMRDIRERVLIPVEGKSKAAPVADDTAVRRIQSQAAAAPVVTKEQLTAQEYFERGLANHEAGNFDNAITDHGEAIRLDPKYAEAYRARGRARYYSGDAEGSLLDFNQAIRMNSKYAEAYYSRGTVYQQLARMNDALSDYNETIRLDPQQSYAYNNRGVVRHAKGDLDGAIADYNEATRLDPQNVEAYNNRGIAHYAKGDLDGAIADYNEAIRLNPNYADVHKNLGLARFQKRDYLGAIAGFEESLRLAPSQNESQLMRRNITKWRKLI